MTQEQGLAEKRGTRERGGSLVIQSSSWKARRKTTTTYWTQSSTPPPLLLGPHVALNARGSKGPAACVVCRPPPVVCFLQAQDDLAAIWRTWIGEE